MGSSTQQSIKISSNQKQHLRKGQIFIWPLFFCTFPKNQRMQSFFKLLAKVNKAILPSYTKKRLDLAKASKFQLALIGWRYYVTTKALS